MIYATVNLFIGERESVCDRVITLYRGDKNVQIRFVLKDNRFTVLNETYAQMMINRPTTPLITEPALITDNTVILTISEDMIDELTEIGVYQFQIRLFDDNMNSRVTLPPCNSSLIIERPIILEDGTYVNSARVNDVYAQGVGEILDVFDEEGNYIKTEWLDGDVISDSRLNKIENGIYGVGEKITNIKEEINIENIDSELQNINNEIQNINNEMLSINNEIQDTNDEMQNINNEMQDANDEIQSINNEISKIQELIDVPPTYIQPSLNINFSTTNNNMIQHDTFTDVLVSSRFTQNDAGRLTSYTLSRDSVVLYEGSTIRNYTDNVILSHGEKITYDSTVIYEDGNIKNTALGNPYPSTSIKGGTVTESIDVYCYALTYYGVIDNSIYESVNGLSNILKADKNNTLNFTLTNQRSIYMYPQSFGTLTSIKDANGFEYINSYTLSTTNIDNVDYYIYILTDPVTISNFKQTFN